VPLSSQISSHKDDAASQAISFSLAARAALVEGAWHPLTVQNRYRVAEANSCPASSLIYPTKIGAFIPPRAPGGVDIQDSGSTRNLIQAPFLGALDDIGPSDVERPPMGADAAAFAG
jgi:hypothetical protein